jgi:hypothetical protein
MGSIQEIEVNFQFEKIFSNPLSQQEWQELQNLITVAEIEEIITCWPRNKSPGPDGYIVEFYKQFKEMLMPDLIKVFDKFISALKITLFPLNDSYITLILKKEIALKPSEFRPISLINSIQKIFSKAMAQRFQRHIPELLSDTQS